MLHLLTLQVLLVVTLCSVPCLSLLADSFNDKRAYVGLKLFRTLVSADLQLAEKATEQGALLLYVVYASNDNAALEYQQSLADSMPSLRNLPVTIKVISLAELMAGTVPRPTALFIAQQLNNTELSQLIGYGIAQQLIVFSPFEGDVEKGVLGGLSVEATVKPLINRQTLHASQLDIKSFYLKVAKFYE